MGHVGSPVLVVVVLSALLKLCNCCCSNLTLITEVVVVGEGHWRYSCGGGGGRRLTTKYAGTVCTTVTAPRRQACEVVQRDVLINYHFIGVRDAALVCKQPRKHMVSGGGDGRGLTFQYVKPASSCASEYNDEWKLKLPSRRCRKTSPPAGQRLLLSVVFSQLISSVWDHGESLHIYLFCIILYVSLLRREQSKLQERLLDENFS